jgi:hypothetical protein
MRTIPRLSMLSSALALVAVSARPAVAQPTGSGPEVAPAPTAPATSASGSAVAGGASAPAHSPAAAQSPAAAPAPNAVPSTAAPSAGAAPEASLRRDRAPDAEPRIGQKLAATGFPEPPPPPPPTNAAPKRVYEDAERLRGGVGVSIGSYVFDTSIPVLGLEGRIGAQLSDLFGIYAAPGFLSGVDPNSGAAVGRLQVGILPEFTVEDVFFVGFGPELFTVDGGSAVEARYAELFHVGGRLRTGVAIGKRIGGQRHAFTIAFDARVDAYAAGAAFAPTLGFGYDAF